MRYLLIVCLFACCYFVNAQSIHPAEKSTLSFLGLTGKLSENQSNGISLRGLFKLKQHEDDEIALNASTVLVSENNNTEDGALQKEYATTSETGITILSQWSGLKSKYLRSDNNLAVGPNHVVQVINSNSYSSLIRVWDKSGTLLINKSYFVDLLGILDYGDPNIIYDEQADRFVITFLYSNEDNKLIICASQTPDPTGAWYVYSFNTPAGFPDYEKLAVWGDSYIVTVAAGKPAVYALNRNNILNGVSVSPVLMFKPYRIPNIGWQGCSPVNQTGSTDIPSEEPAVIVRVIDDAWFSPLPETDHLELFSIYINWDDPDAAYMSDPLDLPIESYNSDLCGFNSNSCIDQKGSSINLWPISDYITDKAKYRNFGEYQSIVCSHVCNADGEGTAGIRWYELRKDASSEWYIYQQSTYKPTNDNRWISSISINDEGTIAMGYNIASNALYPGFRMTGRASCDELNIMTAEETIGKEGTSYNLTLNYGDYNGIVTDPSDGTFWFTGQFNSSPHWSTQVVHFSINSCEDEKIDTSEAASILIYPVPADEQLHIAFHCTTETNTNYNIYDIKGNLLYKQRINAKPGENNIILNTSQFTNSTYIFELNIHGEIIKKPFTVFH